MTKEEFHSWCCTNIVFTRSDQRFMNYVSTALTMNQAITTAQNALWGKIITKHQRQLRRAFTDDQIKQHKAEPWAVPTVETFSFSRVSIVQLQGGVIISFKTPFKQELNSALQTALKDYAVRFNKTYGWYVDYSIGAFRDLLAFVKRKNIRAALCPVAKDIVQQTRQHGQARAWAPMVHPVGNTWVVSIITESMLPHLPDRADHSINAVIRYSALGIAVSPLIRRDLQRQYGQIPAAIASFRRVILNNTAMPNAVDELCRYICIARPSSVIRLIAPVANIDKSTLQPRLSSIMQACEKVGATLTEMTYIDNTTTTHQPQGSCLVITDFSSWLDGVSLAHPTKIVSVINTPSLKKSWKQ